MYLEGTDMTCSKCENKARHCRNCIKKSQIAFMVLSLWQKIPRVQRESILGVVTWDIDNR